MICYECSHCHPHKGYSGVFRCYDQNTSVDKVKFPCSKFQSVKGCHCGAGKFKLPPYHPFQRACLWHDAMYEKYPVKPTKAIDQFFHGWCTLVALRYDSKTLMAEADRYYKYCRIWGTYRYYNAKIRGWEMLCSKKRA